MPHDQAYDYDEFRDVCADEMYLNAWEFRQWLLKHYAHALNPLECLTSLVAALYGRLGRNAAEYEIKAEEIAELFDATIKEIDAVAERHPLVHVTKVGGITSLDLRERSGASKGARTDSWLEHVSATASDDAHNMVAEKYEGGI